MYSTLVADMLAHSPLLPPIIHHYQQDGREFTLDNKKRALLALQHHNCMCCIHLLLPISNQQKFIMAICREFPMLQFMYIKTLTKYDTNLIFPNTFKHHVYSA